MEGLLVGVFVLIVIGCVFWFVFPALMGKYKRDDLPPKNPDINDKS